MAKVITAGQKTVRKFVTLEEFVTANVNSNSIQEVCERTGLKPLSVQQRRVKCRKEFGIELPQFARGGGGKRANIEGAKALLAKLLAEKAASAK